MKTWDEWYSHLDSLVDSAMREDRPDVRDFFCEAQRCRTEVGFARSDSRIRILDELWLAAILLVYTDVAGAEAHRRTAALAYLGR